MSFFYILYQILIMIGTVLGPGSIFIMIAGSMSAVFNLGLWESFAVNLVPIVLYCIICLKTKTDFQINVAQILSIIYALIMVAVIIGLVIQVIDEGWTSPNAMLLEFVIASFIVAAIIHPQEFSCLPNLIIYYITIPSMYLLLVIYSMFNLNVVSWGTREVPKKKTAEEQEAEKVKAEEEAKKKELKAKNTFLGAIFGKDTSTIDLKLKSLFNSHVSFDTLLRKQYERYLDLCRKRRKMQSKRTWKKSVRNWKSWKWPSREKVTLSPLSLKTVWKHLKFLKRRSYLLPVLELLTPKIQSFEMT